jgi:predicted  nucleic acid-binding Zn-ribbon protein
MRVRVRVQDSISALEKLRNELDALTANASSTSAEQKSIENRWSLFSSDLEQAGSLATGLDGILSSAVDDSLQRCELKE